MKQRKDTTKLANLCVGCKHSTIASGKEFICNRPGMATTEIAAAVIDTFFGERCKHYQEQTNQLNKPI